MRNVHPELVSRGHIVTALTVGTIALLMLGLQPILLGEMADTRHASLEGVGLIAMSEIVALGLGVVLGEALLPVGRLCAITILANLLVAGFDFVTVRMTGDAPLAVIRAAAGLGEGVLLWGTTCVIVRSHAADRLSGVFLTVQTIAQSGVAASLACWVIPHASWQGCFKVLAVLTFAASALAPRLPSGLMPLSQQAGKPFQWSLRTAMPLLIAFVEMAAVGSLWAYLEPLGQHAGLNAQQAQTAISLVLFMQVVGGLVAAGSVRRLNIIATLVLCALVLALVDTSMLLLPTGHISAFLAACVVFGFTWMLLMPFQIGLALQRDSSGRVAVLTPGIQLLGIAFGPLVSSLIVKGDDPGSVPLVALGFACAAIAVVLLGQMLCRQGAVSRNAIGNSNTR